MGVFNTLNNDRNSAEIKTKVTYEAYVLDDREAEADMEDNHPRIGITARINRQ